MGYLKQMGWYLTTSRKLLGVLEAEEIHGLQLQAVYTMILYRPEKCLVSRTGHRSNRSKTHG